MLEETPSDKEKYFSPEQVPDDVKIIVNKWGIAEIHFRPDLIEIEVDHLYYIREQLKEIGGGKKMLQFSIIPSAAAMSLKGKEYITSEDARDYTLASAILIDTLSKKIVVNIYLNFYKHRVPVRAFTSREDAFVWLLGFKP